MNLFCANCDTAHDFDLAPDEGVCLVCGGILVENKDELKQIVSGFTAAIVAVVNDGLLATAVARKKMPHGEN